MTDQMTGELLSVLRENAAEQRQTSGALIALTTELREASKRAAAERGEDREAVREQSRRLESVEDSIRGLHEVQQRDIALREAQAKRDEDRAARAEAREEAREARQARIEEEAIAARRRALHALWARLGLPAGGLAMALVAWLSGWIGGADPQPSAPPPEPTAIEIDSASGATDRQDPRRAHKATRSPGEIVGEGVRSLPEAVEDVIEYAPRH